MIEIRTIQRAATEDVVTVYNTATVFTPYCYPLTESLFEEAVTGKECFDPSGFFVAYRARKPVGFIHAGLLDDPEQGSIFLFIAEEREACRRLLAAAVAWMRERSAKTCFTMSNLSMSNKFWGGIHMGYEVGLWQGFYEVTAAFRRNAFFDLTRERFVMTRALDAEPAAGSPTADISMQVRKDNDTGSVYTNGTVNAMAGDTQVGWCGFHLLKRLSEHLGRGIGQITVAVDSRFRRRGIGSALLAEAHRRLYALGARKVMLTTNYQLFPAIKLYEKHGYRKELVHMPVFTGYLE
jgi:ribosomal protein S18 acetylase RimI-like enzyme